MQTGPNGCKNTDPELRKNLISIGYLTIPHLPLFRYKFMGCNVIVVCDDSSCGACPNRRSAGILNGSPVPDTCWGTFHSQDTACACRFRAHHSLVPIGVPNTLISFPCVRSSWNLIHVGGCDAVIPYCSQKVLHIKREDVKTFHRAPSVDSLVPRTQRSNKLGYATRFLQVVGVR